MHLKNNWITRRRFLMQSAVLASAGLSADAYPFYRRRPRLSFSTLGCPDWAFDEILQFAQAHQYQGIEWRGIRRQMDLPSSDAFKDSASRKLSRQKMLEHGLACVNLGSSCTLHYLPGPERMKQLDEGKKYIELAHDLGCPFIRVFPNNFPKGQEKQQTIDLIISGMEELATYASGSGVSVLMETHGDLVYRDDLSMIVKNISGSGAGLIWDPCNMWSVTKEPPAAVFAELKAYIKHVHLKDATGEGDKMTYCLLGKGHIPLADIFRLLQQHHYDGYYSFEWEKLWHPSLPEPALALSDYPIAIQAYFQKKK